MEAIILAGGRGERLYPETSQRPKAMVDILGRPLLAYQIDWLHNYSIKHIIISCGPLWEVIRDYFGDGSSIGINIEYAVETEPLGRGGGIKKAMSFLRDMAVPFYALNGDTLCDADLNAFIKHHQTLGTMATLLLVPYISVRGIVEVSAESIVIGFREKPTLPFWVNAGCYVMNPQLMELLPDKGDHEVTTFPMLASEGRLGAFQTECYWRAIDTMKDLNEARKEVKR